MGSLLEDYKKSQQGGLLDEFKQAKQPEAPAVTPSAPQVQRIPVANAGPYTSGDEFQALLQQAKQVGVENLPEPQKSQVKAAIQGGVVREQDLVGAQIPPAVQDTATALGELAKDFVRSGDPKDVQEYAPSFLEGLDQMLSKSAEMPGGYAAGQSLQSLMETVRLMPDTIPRDNTLMETSRVTKNFVYGAIRMLPELVVGLQQNPYELLKSFVTLPLHEIDLVSTAVFGWKLRPGSPIEATPDEIRKATEELKNNPLGVVAVAMMAMGGAAKGKGEYATINLKEYQRIAEQAKAGGDGLSAMEIVEAADKIVKDMAEPGAPQLTYQPNLGVMKERAKGKVSDRPMTPAEWKEWLANEDVNAPVVTHKKGKAPKVEEKPSVTMGAEDVGKPVPEAKPVETPEVVNTKSWTEPADIAAKEAGDAQGIVYNGQFPATKKQPASYTFYDPQANNTNINVFDLKDLPDRVVEVREAYKKAEADKAAKAAEEARLAEEAAMSTPPVASVKGGAVSAPVKEPWEMSFVDYAKDKLRQANKPKLAEQITTPEQAKSYRIQHQRDLRTWISEGKPVPPEVLKDYPDLAKKAETPPVASVKGELTRPEPVNTGFKEADIARNLAHERVFIKSLEERIKEGDKDPELVKTWQRQLRESKSKEAELMKQVEDVRADNLLGAGLSPDQITAGITNRALREAERRRSASRSEADVSEPAQIEGTIQQPSIRVLHDTKDIGISAGIRTPQGLLGAAPDLPARYGEAAKEAGQTILLTETEIMRESGFRAERLQDALKKADKKDWGKNGDKLYDHIADPSRDGELQPSSLEAVQEVRKFLEEDRQEIIGIKREKLRKSVSTLEEKAYRQANDLVGKKLDEAQIAEVQALAEEALKEKIPDDWGVVNYLPQFHPGSWEILRDGVHVGTAHTPFDAKLKAIEDYASHPELTPDSYTIQGRAFRGGDVVRVGRPRFRKIVSDIADAAEGAVSKDEVSQFLAGKIGTKEGKQKFAGFLQKRQGFEGFSKDLPRVLGMYNQQFVRWKYLSEVNAKIQPLIDKIKKEERPQTAEYVQGMMDYLWGPPPTKASLLLDNTIAKIPGVRDHVKPMLLDRSMGFIKRRTRDAFLTYAARYHVLNRFQRAQTTEPLIDLKESIEGRRFYASAEGKAKLKEFGIRFLTGGKTIEGIQPRLGTLPADVSWATTREKMRSLAPETSNQEIVWATFFKKGKMRGMSDVEASNYAILQGNVYSQFLALRSDTPLIMRGPVGSSVFQFKRFPIKDIELGIDQVQAKNMPGVAKWLGAKLLLGGAKALVDPKLIGGGYIAYATYQKLKDEYGETVANGVMYGLPGLAGVDMSYSFQLAAQPNGDNFKEALGNALLPPWASTLEAAGAAYANDKGLEDNPLQRGVNSLVEKVPSLKFINAMRAWAVSLDKGEYEFRTSDGRLKFQADLKDVLLKAGGFRTVEEGVSQLAVDGFTEIAAERNEILDRTTMKLLQVLNGEGEFNDELFSETMDWNENRPEVPIAADALMTRLRRRVPADQIPEIERKLKALGKNYYYWWKATEGN